MAEFNGTTEKSLIARFDNDNIIKIVDDETEQKFNVILTTNGKEKSAPVKYDGSFSFPELVVVFENTNGVGDLTIINIPTKTTNGILMLAVGAVAGSTTVVTHILFTFDAKEYFYYVNIPNAVNIEWITSSLTENCYYDSVRKRVIIKDPSKNARLSLKIN